MKLESLLNNLINGNLATAKKQAARYGFHSIARAFLDLGLESNEANRAAMYLKGLISFQTYCDAKSATAKNSQY